jgi:hypothetical protein
MLLINNALLRLFSVDSSMHVEKQHAMLHVESQHVVTVINIIYKEGPQNQEKSLRMNLLN